MCIFQKATLTYSDYSNNYFRYIETLQSERRKFNILEQDKTLNDFLTEMESFTEETSIYHVYERLAAIFNVCSIHNNINTEFYDRLKVIITKLVQVKPSKRLKLDVVQTQLLQLENLTKTSKMQRFLLLNSFLRFNGDSKIYDFVSQNTFGLMSEARTSQILTNAFVDDDLQLTQRNTNLCVSFSAMLLLAFSLLNFLKRLRSGEKKEEHEKLEKATVKNPEFLKQLINICCGVISPRSLNGLNHGRLDNYFQIRAQLQDISKSVVIYYYTQDVKHFFFINNIKESCSSGCAIRQSLKWKAGGNYSL